MNVCFQIWYFGTSGPLFGTLVSLEKRRYRLDVICGGTNLQKKVLFSDFLTESCIVFKGGIAIAEIISFIISEVQRCKSIVFDLNLQTNNHFRKRFVLSIVQLTLTCFQMWYVDSLKDLHQMLK